MAFDAKAFEKQVQDNLDKTLTPGLSLAVIKGEEVIYQGFFGYKDREKGLAADENTRYACASVSKSMVVACLGVLRDEGKIDWETPVIEYLPEFRLYDEYATANATLRDLLSHNTGMPRHDAAWFTHAGPDGDHSNGHYVGLLRYLKPNKGFRGGYEYNNFMFATASLIVTRVSGMDWGRFVAQRLWKPLGMNDTNSDYKGFLDGDNVAVGYFAQNDALSPIAYLNSDGMAGYGTVSSTIHDLAIWASFNMNAGSYKGQRLITEKTMGEIFAPRTVVPPMPEFEAAEMPLNAYAHGWTVQPYRGHKCIHHSGNLTGFAANVAFLPTDGYAVVSFVNAGGSTFHHAMTYTIFDQLLDAPDARDWLAYYQEGSARWRKETAEQNQKILDAVKESAKPSHDLADYAGRYVHKGYGTVTIEQTEGGLTLGYAAGRFPLTHCNYDTFYYNDVPGYSFNTAQRLLTALFRTDETGTVSSLEIPIEPALKEPIVFTRDL